MVTGHKNLNLRRSLPQKNIMPGNRQGGFSLVESIIMGAVAVAVVAAIWYFGWAMREPAGQTALDTHVVMVQKSVNLYLFDSNGRFPTDNGDLPANGEYKAINWEASFVTGGQRLAFYPNYVERKPKYWDKGVWLIDSVGEVSVNISPTEY